MQQFGSDPVKSGNRADIVDWSGRRVTEGQHIMQASGDIFLGCGSAVSVTCFDDACLVAKLVGEPVADEHFDVRRHSLGVGRRCGGSVTCSGFVKAFGFS